jgi:hypothetical protein
LILWSLSTVAWCLGSLLRGVPLLGLVPWTSPSAPAAALVSPSTSRRAGPDVGGGIGFLGQNLVFAELVFPRRQSTCCELPVASLYLMSNFVQFASICDGTSQVIRPTYSCPCLTDIRHPVDVPKSLDKFGIFPYLTRNVSPVLQTLQNIGDKEMRKQLHKLTFISKASLRYFITDQTKSECRVVILYKPREAQTPPDKL